MKTVASYIDEFEAGLPFELDPFQREAIEKLDRGVGGVLVSAPTSSGKTMVAEYAIFRALKDGAKILSPESAAATQNESNIGLTASGTLTVTDADITDTVTTSTAASGLTHTGPTGGLKKGDLVLLASVGAGFTVGATLLRWAY